MLCEFSVTVILLTFQRASPHSTTITAHRANKLRREVSDDEARSFRKADSNNSRLTTLLATDEEYYERGSETVREECPPLDKYVPRTGCFDALWVEDMLRADPAPGKVIMNIGCNKGDDAVKWMELWGTSASRFWSTKKWVDEVARFDTLGWQCGSATPPSDTAYEVLFGPSNVHKLYTLSNVSGFPIGVCVEPLPQTVALLHRASAALGYSEKTASGSFHIIQAVVTDQEGMLGNNGTVRFTKDRDQERPGFERIGIPDRLDSITANNGESVALSTVDAIVKRLGLAHVDILTIDVEGNDPKVLWGATSTLRTVRYIEFEVHRDLLHSTWAKTTLRSVVEFLDHRGFDCYWPAVYDGRLVSLNRCWNDRFESLGWQNVVCSRRGDPWSNVLKKGLRSWLYNNTHHTNLGS